MHVPPTHPPTHPSLPYTHTHKRFLTHPPTRHTELSLYDIVHTPGVAADLSHIPTPGKATGFKGAESIEAALKGADVIVIPAGVPRKPGMTRDGTSYPPTHLFPRAPFVYPPILSSLTHPPTHLSH